jgi:hypothetical protein
MIDHLLRFIGGMCAVLVWSAYISGVIKPPSPAPKPMPKPTPTPTPAPLVVYSDEDRRFLNDDQ